MATTTNVTTTYAGQFAKDYIAAAVLAGNTIAQGGITVKPNVKHKLPVKVLGLSGLVGNQACDFTPTGTVNLTERILEPKELQVNLQLCKADFRGDWEAVEMGYSAWDNLPPSFADFLFAQVAAKVAEATESNIWSASAAGAGTFQGIANMLSLDADLPAAQEVAGTTVTAANVIDELGKVVDAIPASLYGREDLYIYVSQNIARAYIRALGGFGSSGLGANGVQNNGTIWYNGGDLSFDGVKLFVANGLGDNTAIATTKENIWFGTGLLADSNMVKAIDQSDIDGSDNVNIIMKYTAGVQYGVVSDIVTYGITNAAN